MWTREVYDVQAKRFLLTGGGPRVTDTVSWGLEKWGLGVQGRKERFLKRHRLRGTNSKITLASLRTEGANYTLVVVKCIWSNAGG